MPTPISDPRALPGRPTLYLASSNAGKLTEYLELAAASPSHLRVALDFLPHFSDLPAFPESAPTLAENAAGKALHYSRFAELPVLADDSGLFVAALDGCPGVHSARYAGPGATNDQRIAKLLAEIRASGSVDRTARFVCVLTLALRGRILCLLSDFVAGQIIDMPQGDRGFGYDPVFFFPPLGKTFAELPAEQKNLHSHRGGAFRKLLQYLSESPVL